MSVADKVILITGAADGIGRAFAEALLERGAKVVIADINGDYAENTKQELIGDSDQAFALKMDVTNYEEVEAGVDKIVEKYGRIDGLVNNAGISKAAMLHKMTIEEFDQVVKVHLYGGFYCIKAVSKYMRQQNSGRIVNITSSAGIQGTIGQINYASAKAGLIGMTKSAAKELAKYNVFVNAVAPAARTKMTNKIYTDPKLKDFYLNRIPLKRFAEAEEIAPMIVHLLSDENTYITGQVININGGSVM